MIFRMRLRFVSLLLMFHNVYSSSFVFFKSDFMDRNRNTIRRRYVRSQHCFVHPDMIKWTALKRTFIDNGLILAPDMKYIRSSVFRRRSRKYASYKEPASTRSRAKIVSLSKISRIKIEVFIFFLFF